MKLLGRFARVLLLVLILLLLTPLLVVAALFTESGSAWVLHQAPRLGQSMGVEVGLEHVAGSLLDRVELKRLNFQGFGVGFSASRFVLQWSPQALFDRTLLVRTLQLDDVELVLPPPVEEEATAPEIPAIELPIAIRLEAFGVDGLRIVQGDTEQRIAALSLSAAVDDRQIALRSFGLQMEGIRVDGRLSMQTNAPHDIDGRLSAELGQQITGDDIGPLSAVADLTGPALAPLIDLRLSRPTELRVHAELQLEHTEPAFSLRAEWPQLGWPLRGQPDVRAMEGRLVIDGRADDYQIQLATRVEGNEVPTTVLDLTAAGDLAGLRIQKLSADLLDGQLLTTGTIGWDRMPRWDLMLVAAGLDPGRYLADWPGRIDGRVRIEGEVAAESDGGLGLRADLEGLTGRLRDQPFTARGRLALAAGDIRTERLQIASGPNRVFVDGLAGERLDLTFDIDAPDLATAYPGLTGQVSGEGRVTGRRQSPSVKARLNGERLGYQDSQARSLRLDIDWQEQGGSAGLRVEGLEAGGQAVAELVAQVSGSPAAHRIKASVRAEAFAVELAAAGGLQGEAWTGELSQLDLREDNLGAWQLDRPAKVELAKSLARASQLCLAQTRTRVCGDGGWSEAAGLDIQATLADLDLNRLAVYLPEGIEISGRLRGELMAKGPVDRPEATFSVRPDDGLLRFTQPEQPLEIAYRNVLFEGRFEDDAGQLNMRLDLADQGQARGSLSLGADRDGRRALGGQISADFPDLGLVSGFVPALDQVSGRLRLESELAGTLESPQISGRLQVLEASARLPDAGITLSEIGLDLSGGGDTPIRVRGGMRSGDGRLALDGEIDARSAGGPGIDLQISGQDFQAVKLPEALVDLSPDLRLQGTGPYHLSGTVKIPRAKIELRELPKSTVEVSDDEIVLGDREAEEPQRTPTNLTAKVRVELGDDVSFSGFGLETGLTGILDAGTDSGGATVDGRIELRDARYQAYGQDLTVERGLLLFAGSPTSPELDMRAVRESRDGQVKAFLSVTGPVSKPVSRVYSEPALPDAEALAYLLTGSGLNEAGSGAGADIASAALSLGISKGDPLLQDLGARLGLDELSVESGSDGIEGSALLLGKYLNPDLYVGYSQGLFNPEGAVLLRLHLTERLEVESRSGVEQSVDLFYRIEHD